MRTVIYLLLLGLATALTDPTYPINGYNNPSPPCSAFCMYTITSNNNLATGCSLTSYGTNDFCTSCDTLLFRPIAGTSGFQCVPHLYNS